MYERIPLKEVGEESDLSNRKCMEILRLKAKELHTSCIFWLIMLLPIDVQLTILILYEN